MLMSRRALLMAGAALPFVSLPARAQRVPGTLTFGLSSYPPNFQPWPNAGTAAATVKLLVHRGLLSYDAQGNMRGELAERWEAEGTSAWVFHLREAVFHDGSPVTSEDVKWTLEQVAAERSAALMRSEFQSVERIETPDARTVRIVTKQPIVTMPMWLANYNMPIVKKDSISDDLPTGVGAGPYVLKSQERGTSVEVEAFPGYYKPGLPKTKTIKLVAYPDENLRVAAIQAGDVDIIEYVPWQAMQAIEADSKLKMEAALGPFMSLVFNGKSGPFTDPRVRAATGFAIRREEIVQSAFFGRGAPLQGMPLQPGTPFFDEKLSQHYSYDPDRAKKLLADAGVPNGFSCTLLSTAQYGMYKSTAEVVQQHLAEIGIQATLSLPDWPTRISLANKGQYEFAIIGNTMEGTDPDALGYLIDGELSIAPARSYGIATPKIHELLAAGRAEFDMEKRKSIYEQVQKQALEEVVPMVPLAWREQAYAMVKDVQGFHNLPGSLTFFSGITLEEAFIG